MDSRVGRDSLFFLLREAWKKFRLAEFMLRLRHVQVMKLVRSWGGAAAGLLGLAVTALLFNGCSSGHYRQSADRQAYRIIQAFDAKVFGRTNEFSIDTRYSGRDPQLIQPAEIIEDRTATNRRVINLDQALGLAVQHSREYQSAKEKLYLKALTLTGSRYEFTPQMVANATAGLAGVGDGNNPGSPNSVTLHENLTVSQFLKTGGRLSVGLANDLARYFTLRFSSGSPTVSLGRDSAIREITVSLAQPLLRGFGKNNTAVEALTQAERDVVYAIRTFSLYQQGFAVDTVTTYFNLLTAKDKVRNNYRDFTNRVETTRYLEARSVDRERKSNVDDARTAELTARRGYINSLASYLSDLDSFKKDLGIPISDALYLEDQDLKELISAGLTPVDIDRDAAFRICVATHMNILNAIDEFEDTKRKVRLVRDQLQPGLDLTGKASLGSDDTDDFFDYTQFDLDKVRYSTTLQLDLPLDRLEQRNAYRSALVTFESRLRELAQTLDNYKDLIDRGLRSLEQARLNYLNGVESLKVAERRVENNVMLLEAGRATIRDLREAQDDLVSAQNDLAAIYTDYLSARLQLLLNIGVIDTAPEKFWMLDPLKDRLHDGQRGAPPLRMPDDKVLPPDQFLEPVP